MNDCPQDLWYSPTSSRGPVAMEVLPQDEKIATNLVSVPLSFGQIYNFRIVEKNSSGEFAHFMTVSKSHELNKYFLYSHISYVLNTAASIQYRILPFTQNKQIHGSPILSSLADNKNLQVISSNNSKLNCSSESDSHSGLSRDKNAQTCDKELTSHQSNHSDKWWNLKVMTYNTWNFFTFSSNIKDYPERLLRLIKVSYDFFYMIFILWLVTLL